MRGTGHDTSIVGDPLLRAPATPSTGAPVRRTPTTPLTSRTTTRPALEPTARRRTDTAARPATARHPDVTAGPRRHLAVRPLSEQRTEVAKDFRPDIEGLRALAVLAVVLYHADLGPFDGGYVGVDVFFVVSGFLITRLLTNEVARTGTVALPRFWARRARRLLPAATLVLVTTVLAARFMLDPLTQGFVSRSALAASGFGANILFWTRGGYSQLTLPEPLLHFWSLAVEEQFYLFWPVIMVGLTRSRGHFRRLAATVAVVGGLASFALCVGLTPSRQPFTFYWLPARAWELLIGAGLALAGPRFLAAFPRLRAGGAWVGLAGIALCCMAFKDPRFIFPGAIAALPVLATALVIIGAGSDTRSGPGRVLGVRPLQWIGQRSYAIYLWHFPFLVLAAAKWGPLSAVDRVLVVLVSLAVAAVSFEILEDPVRRSKWFAERAQRSLRLGAALVVAGALTSIVLLAAPQDLDAGVESAAPALATAEDVLDDGATESTVAPVEETQADVVESTSGSTEPTYPPNPEALVGLAEANVDVLEEAVANKLVPSNLRPSLRGVYDDKPVIYADGCILAGGRTTPDDCVYGTVSSNTTVVLFGDSHAAHWFPAFEKAAQRRGWRLVVMTKMACPTGTVRLEDGGQTRECARWRETVAERLMTLEPDLIVMTSYRYKSVTVNAWQQGMDTTLALLRPTAKQVLVLGDTPTPPSDVPSCVASHPTNVRRCMFPRDTAIKPARLAAEAGVAAAYDADFVATADWLCGVEYCPALIGDVLLYRDESHLTTTGAELLTPYIETMIRGVL